MYIIRIPLPTLKRQKLKFHNAFTRNNYKTKKNWKSSDTEKSYKTQNITLPSERGWGHLFA